MGKMNGVCQRLGGEGNMKLLFNVYFYKMKSILEMDGGDGCTTILNALNTTELCISNGLNIKFCYMYFTTIKNRGKKRS